MILAFLFIYLFQGQEIHLLSQARQALGVKSTSPRLTLRVPDFNGTLRPLAPLLPLILLQTLCIKGPENMATSLHLVLQQHPPHLLDHF